MTFLATYVLWFAGAYVSFQEDISYLYRLLMLPGLMTPFLIFSIVLLSFRSISPPFYEIADFSHRVNMIAIPVLFILIFILQISYERPIRKYLNAMISNKVENADIKSRAKRRLLNAPFFIIGFDLSVWITGAIIYSILYREFVAIELAANRVFYQNALVGLISSTATFFVLEQLLQKNFKTELK
jgi:hypothetical protein